MDVAALLQSKGNDVVTVAPDRLVGEAVTLMETHNVGALVVSADGGSIDGILSERDVVRHLSRRGAELLEQMVSSIATAEVSTCEPGDSVDQLMATMTTGRFRHIPVVVDGQLAGLVSIGDVVKNRVAELELANNQLETYITGVPH